MNETGAGHLAGSGSAETPEGIKASHTDRVGRSPTGAPLAAPPAAIAPQRARRAGPDLAVHLLGSFCVTINDVHVDEWHSARAPSLFGYLLIHRQPWPREVLMEVFWPGVPPSASRNSLNVALHGLRRTLRTGTDAPIIVYNRGAYRIHPGVHLWLDVEEFEERVSRGTRFEEAGEFDQAAEAYEFAAGLYRGEFLADGPLEEWATPIRERLRLKHLDTLDRLSNLHLTAGRHAACVNVCQRIIEQDSCREDAHRRLMRCYVMQGQRHLALMQYRACVRVLADELGVEPERATSELNERIRRHQPV